MCACCENYKVTQKYTEIMVIYLIYLNHHHHHNNVDLLAQISLTLLCHSSLSSITSGRSSRLHPVSIQSCCRQVLASCPTVACPCEGVQRKTSLMNSFLLLQQYPACLVCLIWMVSEMGAWWSYSCLDNFPYLGNSISSTENDINAH